MAEIVPKRVTRAAFMQRFNAQNVPLRHRAFRCPHCGAVQSFESLIKAGKGESEAAVEKELGYTCVACNWSLGGIGATAPIVVVDEFYFFEPATADEARVLMESWRNAHPVGGRP